MLESMINPKRVQKGPVKMLLVGVLYASLSLLLVKLFFSGDPVLYDYAGMIVVTFTVMFSLPFMYYLIKQEEKEDEQIEGLFGIWKMHSDALFAFLWLFFGFLIAFSFWYIYLGDVGIFNAQIETYCSINSPGNIDACVSGYASINVDGVTGSATKQDRLLSIISNNIYVLIFTLLFSLLFGAGAIFILAWNASVIATAVGIFTGYQINQIPLGLSRYMIHGFPEIAAYFIAALAGGIFGVGFLRNGVKSQVFMRIAENTAIMIFVSILILILAAFVEVYFTPILF
ncbi:MAG: stage II sporulation protein M [Candidatus Pacearchaeota archaeon]